MKEIEPERDYDGGRGRGREGGGKGEGGKKEGREEESETKITPYFYHSNAEAKMKIYLSHRRGRAPPILLRGYIAGGMIAAWHRSRKTDRQMALLISQQRQASQSKMMRRLVERAASAVYP